MRTYTIKPYIKEKKDGSKEQIGFIATAEKWKSTNHCAVELCETALRRRENILAEIDGKPAELGKTYRIIYQHCCASA